MNSNTESKENENDLASRICALSILGEVLNRKNPLDVVLDRSEAFASLPRRDRGFARMLVTTTLRRLGQIDDLIASVQNRPDAIKTPVLHHILRMGVCQIFFMDVADHAAVDTAVRLAERQGLDRQKGFVNAILRNLIRDGQKRLDNQDGGRLNTPEWLLKIWINDYGMKVAGQICEAHMKEAPLDITVKDVADRPYWGNVLQASELSTGTLRRISGGNIREMDGFDDGKWWIQDAAAAIPAMLFGDIKGAKVIDFCAAPGGKTLQLASIGAHVTAIDRSANRLKRLKENLERMGLDDNVNIEVSDASVWKPIEAPTHILLDAPCSATGTIRRHPDTGYLKSEADISGLSSIQERLLNHAGDMLAVGGVMIYCTCSLQKVEGEQQIEKFLQSHPDFERKVIDAKEVGDYEELINQDGDVRILPFHLSEQGGIDGFFVSRLQKIK